MTDSEIWETISRRLGVVIALMLKNLRRDVKGLSLKDQVAILDDLGLRPREIAEMLGRSPSYISKELVGIRRGRTKQRDEDLPDEQVLKGEPHSK